MKLIRGVDSIIDFHVWDWLIRVHFSQLDGNRVWNRSKGRFFLEWELIDTFVASLLETLLETTIARFREKLETGFEIDLSGAINHTRPVTRLIANPNGRKRVNNDPRIRECKISAKLARFERFDIVYSDDWRSVCHFDVAYTGPGSTVMQNRDTNLESPIRLPFNGDGDGDCGLSGREIESSRIDVSSRTPPMQMHPSILFFPPFLFLSSTLFPSLSDRSKYSLFIASRERERGVSLAAYATCPIHEGRKSWKGVKKGWRSMLEQVTRTLTTDVERDPGDGMNNF